MVNLCKKYYKKFMHDTKQDPNLDPKLSAKSDQDPKKSFQIHYMGNTLEGILLYLM